jgi:hypothetical protein
MAVPKWEEIERTISLDNEINRKTLEANLAMRMVSHHGGKAHLVALMNLHYEEEEEIAGRSGIDWRRILKLIDKLQGENKCAD